MASEPAGTTASRGSRKRVKDVDPAQLSDVDLGMLKALYDADEPLAPLEWRTRALLDRATFEARSAWLRDHELVFRRFRLIKRSNSLGRSHLQRCAFWSLGPAGWRAVQRASARMPVVPGSEPVLTASLGDSNNVAR